MDMLGALVRKKRALIVPVEGSTFAPGAPTYERLVAPFRCASVDVFVLDSPVGVVSENNAVRHPEFQRMMLPMRDRQAEADASDRVRAWMIQYGPNYEKVVVLGAGPLMSAFSRAMYGVKLPVQVVPVHRRSRGFTSTVLRERLDRAMGV
jgi:hypothetical protein